MSLMVDVKCLHSQDLSMETYLSFINWLLWFFNGFQKRAVDVLRLALVLDSRTFVHSLVFMMRLVALVTD